MKSVLRLIGRLLLGGSFVFAAVQKIIDPAAFATDVGHFRLLPYPLAAVVALYLPWLELIGGAGILCHWRERGALLLTALMCGVFSIALASAWFRGLDINCGCFGHSTAASSLPLAFARSLFFGLLAFYLFKTSKQQSAVSVVR